MKVRRATQRVDEGLPLVVVPDCSDHRHSGAHPGGGDSLVGAFAPVGPVVTFAEDRLPLPGVTWDVDREVTVERADHYDVDD